MGMEEPIPLHVERGDTIILDEQVFGEITAYISDTGLVRYKYPGLLFESRQDHREIGIAELQRKVKNANEVVIR